jgi:hypothetical protein
MAKADHGGDGEGVRPAELLCILQAAEIQMIEHLRCREKSPHII